MLSRRSAFSDILGSGTAACADSVTPLARKWEDGGTCVGSHGNLRRTYGGPLRAPCLSLGS